MKSRNISVYEFLHALQQEYICLEIRSKIYVHREDREYFHRLMEKKKANIVALSEKNGLSSIFDGNEYYMKIWNQIVPEYGLPKFIYNIVNVSKKQLTFPYKGTAVRVLATGEHGVTERVNFSDNTVTVMVDGQLARFAYDEVQRLNHQDTDEFFYFYPNNHFKFELAGGVQVGKLQSYDMKNKSAIVNCGGTYITLQNDEIRRVL